MRKNYFKNFLILTIFLFLASFVYGCSGGGSSITSQSGLIDDSRPKVPISLNLFAAPGTAAIPTTAVGSVEITVYRGTIYDPAREVFNITYAEFSARQASIGVFAGDTYSIVLNAKAKNDPLADTEFVYKASIDSLYVPLEPVSGESYVAPVAMSLNQTAQIKIYPARIAFEPLEKRTVKYGEAYSRIEVVVYDQFGRIFEGIKDSITLSIDPLDNTTITPSITGTATVAPVNGIAVFTNISLAASETSSSGNTRFAASIGASASVASSVVTRSEDILIFNQSNKPVIAGLEFEKQPLPLAGAGRVWDSFRVAIIDQYGNIVDTSETVTLSATAGSLSGTLAVRAQNGIASFTGVTAGAAASINLKASITGFNTFSEGVRIIAGAVSKTRLFVTNYSGIYYYDLYYGDDSSGLVVRGMNAGSQKIDAVKKVKSSFDKEKLYILTDNNKFRVLSDLESGTPGASEFDLGAFNTEKLSDFAPSVDNLSVYLISSKGVYKWHIVNEPNFVIANTNNTDYTNTAGATEIKNNKLYLNGSVVIAPFDFSEYPPKASTPILFNAGPSLIALSGDKKYAAVSEVRGSNVYLIDTATEKFERVPLGQPEPSGTAYLKFSNYGNALKLYLAKYSDAMIYSYNLSSGAGSVIVADSSSTIKPVAIDTDKTGRLLFTLNGSGSAFVRIFDTKNDVFVDDIMLNDSIGQNISYINTVNSMVVY